MLGIRRWAAALLIACLVAPVAARAQPEPPSPVADGDEIGTAAQVSQWLFTNQLAGGPAEFTLVFGTPADTEFFVGDWDGNGIDDLAVRRDKTFTLLNIQTRQTTAISYGKPGDEVFVGDWDGNGTDTFAVRRGNVFYVKNSVASGNADVIIGYGRAGDEVFVGDWDRNGTDTFAVRRGNVFYVRNSVTTGVADVVFGYGRAADQVLVGDWNGDNVDSFAVRRGKEIFIRNDFATAPAEFSFAFGKATDDLYPGDWNGDNIDTFAVRRVAETDELLAEHAVLKLTDLGPGWGEYLPRPTSLGDGHQYPETVVECSALRSANAAPTTGHASRVYEGRGFPVELGYAESEVAVFALRSNADDYVEVWKQPDALTCMQQWWEGVWDENPEYSVVVTAFRASPVPLGDDQIAIQVVIDYCNRFCSQNTWHFDVIRTDRAVVFSLVFDGYAPRRSFIEPVVQRLVAGLP